MDELLATNRGRDCDRYNDRNCGGIDDSLLFFFLLLVVIICNCDMFGGRY